MSSSEQAAAPDGGRMTVFQSSMSHQRLWVSYFVMWHLQLPVLMLFPVVEIFHADIYRDGGSRCFCYHSDDGNWYEFHVRIKWSVDGKTQYLPPVLYLGSVNDREVVHEFTWEEARDFISDLQFDDQRFSELIEVVLRCGASPTAT